MLPQGLSGIFVEAAFSLRMGGWYKAFTMPPRRNQENYQDWEGELSSAGEFVLKEFLFC